jgi:hypothetical protein
MKKFLDDPNRNVEPHEYSDFHKELIQVLNEVKQESELLPPADEPINKSNFNLHKL